MNDIFCRFCNKRQPDEGITAKMKKTFYTEAAYICGIIVLSAGTVLMERAGFGMSMVVAPAYLVYLKLAQHLPWFTFGMAEYCLQAVLLCLCAVLTKRFRPMYLFSFVTAVIYGFVLDAMMSPGGFLPADTVLMRVLLYSAGMVLGAAGVALLFHTYIAPEAYELLVREISAKFQYDIRTVKTVYDCCSCLAAVILSFAFFGLGHFEGIKAGTVLCALVNGRLIGRWSDALNRRFALKDGLQLRQYFE